MGIRELRADLSRWVRRVRAGEEVVVTDRGTAVAKLVPFEGERTIDRLIRAGLVTPAPSGARRTTPSPVEGGGPLSDLVSEGRG